MYHNRYTNTMERIEDSHDYEKVNPDEKPNLKLIHPCCTPDKKKEVYKNPKKYNAKINMQCNIEKKHLHDIMDFILVECGLYVFGYDIRKDSFWGKRQDHLHFTLKIKNINSRTQLRLKIIMDDHNQMNHICAKIAEIVNIYEDTFDS